MKVIYSQIERIREEKRNHRLVIFVGAGVSKNSGACSWWELVKEIADSQICKKFKEKTGIDCSPQANRDGIKNLKVTLFNNESNGSEEIVCELHTKFSKY